ncbi:MAG: hypothetical protein AB7O70_02875 [Hyphomicrobiales bacterium]
MSSVVTSARGAAVACVLLHALCLHGPGARAQEVLCAPLQQIIDAAAADFSALGTLPTDGQPRRAEGSVLLPDMDSCGIDATEKTVTYGCVKSFAERAGAIAQVKAYDEAIRACRPGAVRNVIVGVHVYEEPYGESGDVYLMMDMGVDSTGGRHLFSIGIGLDK